MGTSAFRLGATQSTTTKLSETIEQPSHGFTAGDVIRSMSGTTGAFQKAQADNAENAEALGVVSDVGGVNSFTVIYGGEINTSGLTGFGQGDVLFLSSTSAGQLTTSAPTLPGQVIKPVVVMTDTNNSTTNEGLVINYVGQVIGGDAAVEVSNLQPVGTIIPWGGVTGTIPTGWLWCDGATYYGGYTGAGSTYSDLYDVVGTAFGGSGTNGSNDFFHVPNMLGRVPVGAGISASSGLTQRVLGAVGGGETADAVVNQSGTLDTQSTGSNNEAKVSVMQPFTVTNYLIRYEKNSRASISGLIAGDLADVGTGATSGNILQYEGAGTTGVYDNVTVSAALTKDAPIGFTGNLTMNSGNLDVTGNATVSGSATVGGVASGIIIDQHGISAGDNTIGITGNITATDFASGNITPTPSNTIGGFGQVVPLLYSSAKSNGNSMPGGVNGASWFVHVVSHENVGGTDEDPIFVLARTFDVPANQFLRLRTNPHVTGSSGAMSFSISTNSAGDTSGTWTTFNSHGLSAAHELGNTYAESGVSGGAVFNPAVGTTASVAHGFAMRFN